jgi:hypothetical protein
MREIVIEKNKHLFLKFTRRTMLALAVTEQPRKQFR